MKEVKIKDGSCFPSAKGPLSSLATDFLEILGTSAIKSNNSFSNMNAIPKWPIRETGLDIIGVDGLGNLTVKFSENGGVALLGEEGSYSLNPDTQPAVTIKDANGKIVLTFQFVNGELSYMQGNFPSPNATASYSMIGLTYHQGDEYLKHTVNIHEALKNQYGLSKAGKEMRKQV